MDTLSYIHNHISNKPRIGIILGSGLSALADEIENKTVLNYKDIPGFPESTVEGHKGELVFGSFRGKDVVLMNGRFHYYEGYSMEEVCFPVRVLKRLGVSMLIVTCAAGGINKDFTPGDLMLITDHIKLFSQTPLRGPNDDSFGPRFNTMHNAYTKELLDLAFEAAYSLSIPVKSGVYAYMPGPSYETPAEINALRILGADAVGMSTVGEVITANHAGMKVLGISCISNMAAGVLDKPLNHDEVIETTRNIKDKFSALLREIVFKIQ